MLLSVAWHPWFNTSTGTSRVDFSWEPNRPLFYALFKHMQHLGRRGCHRTALEVCKLLLSLDSDDPMGSLFCIDYFALRAEQYEWLQRFVREYGKERSLALLPSFSLSLALAQFHLEAKRSNPSTARYFQVSLIHVWEANIVQGGVLHCVTAMVIDVGGSATLPFDMLLCYLLLHSQVSALVPDIPWTRYL